MTTQSFGCRVMIYLVTGIQHNVLDAMQDFKAFFERNDLGPIQEHVECKEDFDWAKGSTNLG